MFRDFLIKPIQRLCLYPLVLQTLLKYTPDVGMSELASAVAAMRRVADDVDEAGRRREQALMADLIVSRVEGHYVSIHYPNQPNPLGLTIFPLLLPFHRASRPVSWLPLASAIWLAHWTSCRTTRS